MEFLHPAMWQVALRWHAIKFAKTFAILEFYFWIRFLPYHRSRHVICTSLRNFIQIGLPSAEKKITSCRFSRCRISVILDFRGPIMGSLKSPCTTSYRSSIETMALNCLVFEKIADLHFGNRQTDRQTDRQTNRWTGPLHEAAFAVASGGLTRGLRHGTQFGVPMMEAVVTVCVAMRVRWSGACHVVAKTYEMFKNLFPRCHDLSRLNCFRDIWCHAFCKQFVIYAWQMARHGANCARHIDVLRDFVPLKWHDLRGIAGTKFVPVWDLL